LSRNKYKTNCFLCGKEFLRYPSQRRKSGRVFCSPGCLHLWLKKQTGPNNPQFRKIKTECAFCDKILFRNRYKVDNQKNQFCDNACHGKWRSKNIIGKNSPDYKERTIVLCSYCGRPKKILPSSLGKTAYFCNIGCKGLWEGENCTGENGKNWKGGVAYLPYCPSWGEKNFKLMIKNRDNYKCQNWSCSKKSIILCVHHIDYDKMNCSPSNLITLCLSCNSKANSQRKWHRAYYQAMMTNKGKKLEAVK